MPLEVVRVRILAKHYSPRAKELYTNWIKKFV